MTLLYSDTPALLTFLEILCVVWGILNIVLFFKIWGMTNDVTEIRNLMANRILSHSENNASSAPSDKDDTPISADAEDGTLAQGALVVEKATGKQMRIKEITADGKFSCYRGNYMEHCGDFTSDQIESFKDYTSKLNK